MTAIVGPLQLDDDQVSGAIERQQVDPTPSVLPLPELLRGDQQILAERGWSLPEQSLQF